MRVSGDGVIVVEALAAAAAAACPSMEGGTYTGADGENALVGGFTGVCDAEAGAVGGVVGGAAAVGLAVGATTVGFTVSDGTGVSPAGLVSAVATGAGSVMTTGFAASGDDSGLRRGGQQVRWLARGADSFFMECSCSGE